MTIKLNYYVPSFSGEMFEIEEISPSDLPVLAAYWESDSCCNVKSWEIVYS